MRAIRGAAAAASAALVLACAGCGGSGDDSGGGSQLKAAAQACAKDAATALEALDADEAISTEDIISSSEDSVEIATPLPGGDMISAIALAAAQCVLHKTDAPATISSEMGSASALSGPGKDDYSGYRVTWSFDGTSGGQGFSATFATD